jgi:hypothetical protein
MFPVAVCARLWKKAARQGSAQRTGATVALRTAKLLREPPAKGQRDGVLILRYRSPPLIHG